MFAIPIKAKPFRILCNTRPTANNFHRMASFTKEMNTLATLATCCSTADTRALLNTKLHQSLTVFQKKNTTRSSRKTRINVNPCTSMGATAEELKLRCTFSHTKRQCSIIRTEAATGSAWMILGLRAAVDNSRGGVP